MKSDVSIAIETSCRVGGVALGVGDVLGETVRLDASARHATQLLCSLDGLLGNAGLQPGEIQELYVSVGPGSFTGLRIGITAARTLGQAVRPLRCVAVPTVLAVVQNALTLEWNHLGVVMDAGEGSVYTCLFARRGGDIVQVSKPAVGPPDEFLTRAPRPLLLIGEGLEHHKLIAEEITIADASLHMPTAEGVWRVGRRLGREGEFTDYRRLLPIYTRKPQALQLWEQRNKPRTSGNRRQ